MHACIHTDRHTHMHTNTCTVLLDKQIFFEKTQLGLLVHWYHIHLFLFGLVLNSEFQGSH